MLDLQELFDQFNKGGSTMKLYQDGYTPIDLGLCDSYLVTRVEGDQFWLFHKAAGYNNSSHYSHTAKIVAWSQVDTYLLDLVDDVGQRYHIELIFPEQEPDLAEDWKRWQAYKRANRKSFERMDAHLLEVHSEIANTWIQA